MHLRKNCRSRILTSAAVFGLALMPTIAAAHGSSSKHDKHSRRPPELRQQGSFFIGGRDIAIPYGQGKVINPNYEPPDVIKIDQMYVQYAFPEERGAQGPRHSGARRIPHREDLGDDPGWA